MYSMPQQKSCIASAGNAAVHCGINMYASMCAEGNPQLWIRTSWLQEMQGPQDRAITLSYMNQLSSCPTVGS